jgi:hypothetical protein
LHAIVIAVVRDSSYPSGMAHVMWVLFWGHHSRYFVVYCILYGGPAREDTGTNYLRVCSPAKKPVFRTLESN